MTKEIIDELIENEYLILTREFDEMVNESKGEKIKELNKLLSKGLYEEMYDRLLKYIDSMEDKSEYVYLTENGERGMDLKMSRKEYEDRLELQNYPKQLEQSMNDEIYSLESFRDSYIYLKGKKNNVSETSKKIKKDERYRKLLKEGIVEMDDDEELIFITKRQWELLGSGKYRIHGNCVEMI